MSVASLMSILQWWPFDFFGDFFAFTFILMIVGFVFFGVFFAIIVYIICRAVRANRTSYQMYEVPTTPGQPTRRVVRETLPTKCPSCLGPISYEKVDWVGPRQAKCPYCGNIMELQVQETTESQ